MTDTHACGGIVKERTIKETSVRTCGLSKGCSGTCVETAVLSVQTHTQPCLPEHLTRVTSDCRAHNRDESVSLWCNIIK